MRISELTSADVRERLLGDGLTWQVGPFVIRARLDRQDFSEGLTFLYQHFPVLDDDCVPDVELETRSRWFGRFDIWIDGDLYHCSAKRNICMPLIEWCLNLTVFQRPHQFLLIHSAVVERDGRALILPGLPRAGKSTLCAALVNRGWRLLSDEVALVRVSEGDLVPVPRPVSLKDGSIPLIQSFAPSATLGPVWHGTTKGSVAHMLPPQDSVDASGVYTMPAWLVFPQYIANADACLTPESKSRALVLAADNSFNYSVLGRQGFLTLADLIDRCECYRFTYSRLEDAIHCFDELSQSEQHSQTAAYV